VSEDGLRLVTDAVVIAAVAAAALAAAGMRRVPDLYLQVHAAATVPFLTLLPLALLQAAHGSWLRVAKALLVVGFLMLTSALASHVIAASAFGREQAGDDERDQEDDR
jgi:monovalent cation/proton antiporter MnhG/PhaG subunit